MLLNNANKNVQKVLTVCLVVYKLVVVSSTCAFWGALTYWGLWYPIGFTMTFTKGVELFV